MEKRLDVRLSLNTRLLPALVGLLLLLQIIAPYRGWWMLLVGLGGGWLLSYVWARSLARRLRLARAIRFGWAQVGDDLIEQFELTNDSWLPAVWVEVEDGSTIPGYQVGRGISVGSGRAIRWHTGATCAHRGLFTLGPTIARTGDPLGFYTVTLCDTATRPLLILPPILPLPAIEVAPGGRMGEGRFRSHSLERTVSSSGVREHRPGDSLNWIHWPTSARKNELFVRRFDTTSASDWWILLDMDRSVQRGVGPDGTEECAVILAASLANQGLRSGRAVGLVAGGTPLVWLPPRQGEGQRWEILRSLAIASLCDHPLDELLRRVGPTLGKYASLVLVTPAADPAWVDPLLSLLWRGIIPTVLLLDPISFGGQGELAPVCGLLSNLGVTHYVLTRDVLDQTESRPARSGRRAARAKVVPGYHISGRAMRAGQS